MQVGGITHTNASEKTAPLIFTMALDAEDDYLIDVTVVQDLFPSVYFYSGFSVSVAGAAINSPAPSAGPTRERSTEPTVSPPTDVPSALPTVFPSTSAEPSTSSVPSTSPSTSVEPSTSSVPSTSAVPSQLPSTSSEPSVAPSVYAMPTFSPTAGPSSSPMAEENPLRSDALEGALPPSSSAYLANYRAGVVRGFFFVGSFFLASIVI